MRNRITIYRKRGSKLWYSKLPWQYFDFGQPVFDYAQLGEEVIVRAGGGLFLMRMTNYGISVHELLR